MSELVKIITQKLIDDTEFMITFENKLNEIMNDHKITSNDIPDIILLVIHCTENLNKFNLTYNELGEVLEEVILFLMNKFNIIPENEKNDFAKMTNTIIKLVLVQPKVKSCLTSFYEKIKCW